jgi:hypothetical protein
MLERPKAKALGYLDARATTRQQQIPFGNDNKKSKGERLSLKDPKGRCWLGFFGVLHCVQDDGNYHEQN